MKMKTLLTVALCLALLGLAACKDSGKPRVAVVDAEKVLTECQAGKKGMDILRAKSNELTDKLKKMQSDMGDDKAKDKLDVFQQALGQARMEINREQSRIMGILQSSFEKAVEDYRAKNGLDVILVKDQALAVSPEADATKAIVAAMDAMNIDVTPKAEPETKPEAAAPAEKDLGEQPKAAAPEAAAPQKAPEAKPEAPAKQ
ncbi:outer membrane chaperone Skp (OmpH) [Desulfovibrio sp. X2]|uniref:OmpH family outer membrane protein n=1 Tax=Desulfovibrio sp. X2 TaxID=941449 RepID=UPI000358AD80|nr:OmpH family outer membrane protein [Desulfovibrio sp. X2]EPR44786.1 outer membrane chaperone Skp (OmpH) [Desulfovibrio sp. X2]